MAPWDDFFLAIYRFVQPKLDFLKLKRYQTDKLDIFRFVSSTLQYIFCKTYVHNLLQRGFQKCHCKLYTEDDQKSSFSSFHQYLLQPCFKIFVLNILKTCQPVNCQISFNLKSKLCFYPAAVSARSSYSAAFANLWWCVHTQPFIKDWQWDGVDE